MTIFLRLLADKDKAGNLLASCSAVRTNAWDGRVFDVASGLFRAVPGAPFAYWVSQTVRLIFINAANMNTGNREVMSTNPLNYDFRYVRMWIEVSPVNLNELWIPWAKGGAYSKFYYDIDTVIIWDFARSRFKGFLGTENRPLDKPASLQHFFRPGLTWPRRTQGGLSFRALPRGCIFADKGPAAFVADNAPEPLLALLALVNSKAFFLLVSLQMAFGSYEVGVIQRTPVPNFSPDQQAALAALARRAWSLKRTLDTIDETSHAFLLPAMLRTRLGDYDPPAIEAELTRIQAEIDVLAFDLYGFSDADRAAALAGNGATEEDAEGSAPDDDNDDDDSAAPIDQSAGLLSWAIGVAFGRFDWRLATGERAAPPEPEPFDPLPAKSPGMLPDGAEPFHGHAGILVDDPGHPHDLARLMEDVLVRVDVPAPSDVRRWLQRDFFPFHLQRYSKSRRKAPIYWPLAARSGTYTLWLYYPDLTSQTLYTAVNDVIEPKLKQVGQEAGTLRGKTGRSRDEDRVLEALQTLELDLIDLRDTLLRIAPTYRPNHDDGVQISAAPLWPLFRHKPWAKVLKDTWAKLEKGDYDWSHLAMTYWPDRVRKKCTTDKSLAIAHDLEHLYVEPERPPAKPRGRRKGS